MQVDPGSIPGLGRSPGEGNGNPLQYSRLEKSMDRGAWRAKVHGVANSWTQLSTHAHRRKKKIANVIFFQESECVTLRNDSDNNK